MKKLFNLAPEEVSLVPRGANKKKFLIYKNREGKVMKQTEIQKLINSVDAKTMTNIEKVIKKMSKGSKVKKGDEMPAKKDAGANNQVTDNGVSHSHTPLSDRAQAALKAVARILAPFKDEISDDHLDAVQGELGMSSPDQKTPSDDNEGKGEVEMSVAYPEGVEEEHHAAALDMAKKAYMGHLGKMGYQKYPEPSLDETNGSVNKDEDGDEDDDSEEGEGVSKVNKSEGGLDLTAFPEGQRGQLEKVFKAFNAMSEQNKELIKKNSDLEKEIKHERDQRVLKEFEDRAKGFKHLGAETSELAKVMKSLSEKDPESFTEIEKILKAADAQVSQGGLFKEIGSRAGGASSGSAEAQLDKLVDSVVAKSDGKSREQVYEEVLKTKEGAKLYQEFKKQRPQGI